MSLINEFELFDQQHFSASVAWNENPHAFCRWNGNTSLPFHQIKSYIVVQWFGFLWAFAPICVVFPCNALQRLGAANGRWGFPLCHTCGSSGVHQSQLDIIRRLYLWHFQIVLSFSETSGLVGVDLCQKAFCAKQVLVSSTSVSKFKSYCK